MKQWQAAFFIFGGIAIIAVLAACPSTPKPEDDFLQNMKRKWNGIIVERFDKETRPGAFTKGTHQLHAKWGQDKKGKQGCVICHPGGNEKAIPPMPESCFNCHDRQTKIPIKDF